MASGADRNSLHCFDSKIIIKCVKGGNLGTYELAWSHTVFLCLTVNTNSATQLACLHCAWQAV